MNKFKLYRIALLASAATLLAGCTKTPEILTTSKEGKEIYVHYETTLAEDTTLWMRPKTDSTQKEIYYGLVNYSPRFWHPSFGKNLVDKIETLSDHSYSGLNREGYEAEFKVFDGQYRTYVDFIDNEMTKGTLENIISQTK